MEHKQQQGCDSDRQELGLSLGTPRTAGRLPRSELLEVDPAGGEKWNREP